MGLIGKIYIFSTVAVFIVALRLSERFMVYSSVSSLNGSK